MQLIDRIEKRRFVGREFLLWLWFESETFDATLSTKEHGSFGLWIERQIILTLAKESTRIKGAQPAASREAKEALLLGKLPESAGFHLSWHDTDRNFTLKAERLAIAGLSLPTVLDAANDDAKPDPLLTAPRAPRRKKPVEADAEHEIFYERMHLTREFESVIEALYRDFLTLRLGAAWSAVVVPAMRAWAGGEEVDAEEYRAARDAAVTGKKKGKKGT